MDFFIPDESFAIRSRIEVEQEERSAIRRSWRDQAEDLKTKIVREPKKAALYKRQLTALEAKALPSAITVQQLDRGLAKFPFRKWDYAPFAVKLAKGETAVARIESLDRAIMDATNEQASITEKRPPLAEMRARAKSFLDALAANGCPSLTPRGDIEMPSIPTPIRVGHNVVSIPDGVALVAWLLRDELMKRVDTLLTQAAPKDAGTTMNASERRAALKSLETRMHDLHRERAACVELAVADGVPALHRPDAPFDAVLAIVAAD